MEVSLGCCSRTVSPVRAFHAARVISERIDCADGEEIRRGRSMRGGSRCVPRRTSNRPERRGLQSLGVTVRCVGSRHSPSAWRIPRRPMRRGPSAPRAGRPTFRCLRDRGVGPVVAGGPRDRGEGAPPARVRDRASRGLAGRERSHHGTVVGESGAAVLACHRAHHDTGRLAARRDSSCGGGAVAVTSAQRDPIPVVVAVGPEARMGAAPVPGRAVGVE